MSERSFEAVLIRPEGAGTWTYVDIPFDVHAEFGQRGQVKVQGTVNGQPYRSSARPHGDGRHYLVVNKEIRDAAGVQPGDTVRVVMAPDTAARTVEVPADLARALAGDEAAAAIFERLSFSHQKAFVEWIEEAKKEETRQRRVEKTLEMLAAGKRVKG